MIILIIEKIEGKEKRMAMLVKNVNLAQDQLVTGKKEIDFLKKIEEREGDLGQDLKKNKDRSVVDQETIEEKIREKDAGIQEKDKNVEIKAEAETAEMKK
jgi:hypothetical protein